MDFISDRRQDAPATQNNKQPILQVLQRILPSTGTILEIASGTGQHSIFFAPRLSPRKWLPSEPNPELRLSIAAWQNAEPSENLYPPLALDVCENPWSIERGELPEGMKAQDLETDPIRAIVNINMIHISPWQACLGLMAGAQRLLPKQGILYLYGPFKQKEQTAPSNLAFDRSLQTANPAWGVRELDRVISVAANHDLKFLEVVPMPANNLSVIFQR